LGLRTAAIPSDAFWHRQLGLEQASSADQCVRGIAFRDSTHASENADEVSDADADAPIDRAQPLRCCSAHCTHGAP
jgi:cytosine/adenosine deaminase-related metal-dependent hydrolase